MQQVSDEAKGWEMQPRKSGNGAVEKKGRENEVLPPSRAVVGSGGVEEGSAGGREGREASAAREGGRKQGLWVT